MFSFTLSEACDSLSLRLLSGIAMQTVTLSLYRFDRILTRGWLLGQMALARRPLGRMPGLEFWKLCGSGTGEGFTPRPNWAVWAILGVWRDARHAREGLAQPPFARWRARSDEACTFTLQPSAARGAWSGLAPFAAHEATGGASDGPIAVLTRATIRPQRVWRFWARGPDISARIGQDPNVAFKIGIGEVPWLHQVTFSVWPDVQSMAAFARRGPHAEAIRAVREEGWFSEELYARFRICGVTGRWQGQDPLANLSTKEAA